MRLYMPIIKPSMAKGALFHSMLRINLKRQSLKFILALPTNTSAPANMVMNSATDCAYMNHIMSKPPLNGSAYINTTQKMIESNLSNTLITESVLNICRAAMLLRKYSTKYNSIWFRHRKNNIFISVGSIPDGNAAANVIAR